MKLLISIALLGVILSEVCNAQTVTCNEDEIQSLTSEYSMCAVTAADCFANVCDCCTEALNTGSSDSNYECCSAYAGLLQCTPGAAGLIPCPGLAEASNGDGATVPVPTLISQICIVSGVMILVSSAVNQLFL